MKRKVFGLMLLLFGVISALYILQTKGTVSVSLTNTVFLLPPFLATIAGFDAVTNYHISSPRGKVMAYLTAGLTCWFIGEFIFYLYQFYFKTDPFPSIADVFYIAAYPLLLVGLIKEIKVHGIKWRELNKLTVVLGSVLVAALAFIVIYFGIYLAFKPGEPVLNNAIALGYGIGDLILLIPVFFILKVALDFRGGKLFNSWMLVFLALLFIMAGDILFAIYTDQYEALQAPYTLIDLTWAAGYLLFAYSSFYTTTTIKELQNKILSGGRNI